MTSQDKAPVIQADRIAASEITDLVVTALSEAEGPGFSIDEVAEIIARARITREAELSRRLGEALQPVLHWYQSDEHEPRELLDIVADAVTDLQSDRANNLQLRAAVSAAGNVLASECPTHEEWQKALDLCSATLTLIREGEQQ